MPVKASDLLPRCSDPSMLSFDSSSAAPWSGGARRGGAIAIVSKLREISWHDECMRIGSLVRFRRSASPMAAVATARRSCDETMTERPSPAVSTSKSA